MRPRRQHDGRLWSTPSGTEPQRRELRGTRGPSFGWRPWRYQRLFHVQALQNWSRSEPNLRIARLSQISLITRHYPDLVCTVRPNSAFESSNLRIAGRTVDCGSNPTPIRWSLSLFSCSGAVPKLRLWAQPKIPEKTFAPSS